MPKELIFLETSAQVRAFLKEYKSPKETVVIALTLEAEIELDKYNFVYKCAGDYESKDSYKGIDKDSINLAKKISASLNIQYKGIDMVDVFRWDLSYYMSYLLQRIILFRKIISKEKPSTIVVFDKKTSVQSILIDSDETLHSEIVPLLFKNVKIKLFKEEVKKEKSKAVDFLSYLQTAFSRIAARLSGGNKIMLVGTKEMFFDLAKSLPKNYSPFIFKEGYGRSFMTSRRFVPFISLKNMIFKRSNFNLSEEKTDKLKEIQYKEVKLYSLIKPRLNILGCQIGLYKKYLDMIERFLSKNHVRAVVLMNDANSFEKLVALTAKKFGIPTAVVQHGITGHEIGFVPLSADFIMVWGEESKSWLIKRGIDKNRIIITGSPRHEVLSKGSSSKKIKKVLYVPQISNRESNFPNYHITLKERKEILRMVLQAFKENNLELTISVRLGDQNEKLIDKIAKEVGFSNYKKYYGKDIVSAIKGSDLVLTQFSTVGIEGLLLGKPLITLEINELGRYVPFSKYGASQAVKTKEQLKKALDHPSYKPDLFLKKYLYIGNSALKNVILALNKMTQHGRYTHK